MKKLQELTQKLAAECDFQTSGRSTRFIEEAEECLERLEDARDADDAAELRAAAAAYGGLMKRWRRYLIQQITAVAFEGVDTSREKVRQWQKDWFGQSLASSALSCYARPDRSGAGRAAADLPSMELSQECSREFEALRDELRRIG